MDKLFAQNSSLNLTENDFASEGEDPLALKLYDCMLVLFYRDDNDNLKSYLQKWLFVSQQVVGPIFSVCNLSNIDKNPSSYADEFDKSNKKPFILFYQGGHPITSYNGEYEIDPLIDYALSLVYKSHGI
jgi:hypothetical protein